MENKEIKKKLKSSEVKIVLDILKYITKEGSNDILVNVIDLLRTTTNTLIRDEIIKILENLKEQSSASIIIKSIKDSKYQDELSILVSACWKNNLNYEYYLDIFTDVFIKSDFQLAFDALTVIDNFEKADKNSVDISLVKLENSIEDFKDDKKTLSYELISIIQHLKENPTN